VPWHEVHLRLFLAMQNTTMPKPIGVLSYSQRRASLTPTDLASTAPMQTSMQADCHGRAYRPAKLPWQPRRPTQQASLAPLRLQMLNRHRMQA
jgi:hypothetical protein